MSDVMVKSSENKKRNVDEVKINQGIQEKNCIYTFASITMLIVSTGLAFVTRFYKLSEPDHVCWDETHFGKMGSYYINRTFFFDVHPPLGKMLIGLAGKLSGYDGSFLFEKPGDKYEDINYMGMRIFCSTLGTLVVPLMYLTVLEMSKSTRAAFLASVFIIFDTGTLTLSQYILLDPILLFFIMASVFSLMKFKSLGHKPFKLLWWFWMSMTGIFLSCTFSVKWVGLFVILFAGAFTAWDLWMLLGNVDLSKVTIVKHFLARVLCLIVLPVLIYITFFAVHFKLLNKSGSGDGFYSSAFQSKLLGNSLYNASMPETVAYGSIITLKNHRSAGGLLHSHWHLYPDGVGAKQQQVTAYTHKDENNKWVIKRYNIDLDPDESNKLPVQYVRNGDLIRLEHIPTRRNLHSHYEPAPLTFRHQQVTCYGENGTGDANDIWRVDVPGGKEGEKIKVVRTKMRLIHYITGCALHSHSKTLPSWGWEQLEVTCSPFTKNKKILWNVEDHFNSRLPNISFEVFAPSFLDILLESHIIMAQGNSGLKPKDGEVTSRPWQWPINYRGQRFSGFNQTDVRIYLLGNPIIWWGNLAVLLLFVPVFLLWSIRYYRGSNENEEKKDEGEVVFSSCLWLFFGWAVHYLPFYLMGRVLYFHHYFPALLFNCMLTGIFLDHVLKQLDNKLLKSLAPGTVHHSGLAVLCAVVIHSFCMFYPLSYGMYGPLAHEANSSMSGLKWISSWEI